MTSLFVVSTETFTGKTALVAGLMQHLQQDGYRAGYLKPVSATPHVTGRRLADEDAQFIKQTFKLAAPISKIVPVELTASIVDAALENKEKLSAKVKTAFDELSAESDVMIIEGGGDLGEGGLFGLSAPEIAELLDLPILVVSRYTAQLSGDDILLAHHLLGKRLIGAVINAVPRRQHDLFSEKVVPILEGRGIPILGLLPRERLLTAASVHELAVGINGKILAGEENIDALVENLTVGAMGVAHALGHFRRMPNKAVITGGDRSDIHLAALETSTRCLILTGDLYPNPKIISQAEKQGVPIILSSQSTLETVETINQFFGRTRFHETEKLELFQKVFESNFDFTRLYSMLSL